MNRRIFISFLGIALAVWFALYSSEGSEGSEGSGTKEKSEKNFKEILLNPDHAEMKKKSPDTFKVKLETSQGDVVLEINRAWSPHGVDRFYNLVRHGFYDEIRFFRVLSGFMAQFGISGDPEISKVWGNRGMPDDPVKQSNKRGFITYAKSGLPNSRSTQLFINYGNNAGLDGQGFAPFGKVVEGMKVIDKLYSAYGEGAPRGKGPSQGVIQSRGNEYLKKDFSKLDWIKKASILN